MIRPGELSNGAVFSQELEQARPGGGRGAVTPGQVASYWGVHVNTVYRDIGKGALRAFRLPGGGLRIRRDDARRYGRPVE